MKKPIRSHTNGKNRFRPLAGILLLLLLVQAGPSAAAALRVDHDLRIRLEPGSRELIGRDDIVLSGIYGEKVVLFLSSGAVVANVALDRVRTPFQFGAGRLEIPVPKESAGRPIRVTVRYSGRFDDPFPDNPVNADNPGYGVTGIVSDRGTFLLAGAGWYPRSPDAGERRFHLEVDGPEGIVAVTAGRALEVTTKNGRTVSIWEADRAIEGLALSAGPYRVSERAVGDVTAATYFSESNAPLSKNYLDGIETYLRLYEGLFGPYAFHKFAVVENFFPTGYGFPSYTLIGARILRLPFIVRTSLGHEIAHCWWGNGVLVDATGGNWSEGLTTYVADYLYREQVSPESARQYRIEMLRNYATLVDKKTDFPLNRFRSRIDRPTKVIGYDKSAMVFHMLRRLLGEAVFWGALRDIYRAKRFQPASWDDFRRVFESRSGAGPCCTLEPFFKEWLDRPGALDLTLEAVRREKEGSGWIVSGKVVQADPVYHLAVDMALETDAGETLRQIGLNGAETRFEFALADAPRSVSFDPDAEVFRRLHPSEIPPAVNSIKGSTSVLVVLAGEGNEAALAVARMLVRSLGLERARIIRESSLSEALLRTHDLLFVGLPEHRLFLKTLPDAVTVGKREIIVNGTPYRGKTDTFFGVFPHPLVSGRKAALFRTLGTAPDLIAARKVTHYGKYGYLVFSGGENRDKGIWPVTESPLVVRFENREDR